MSSRLTADTAWEDATEEQLISALSYVPSYVINGMIRIKTTVEPPSDTPSSSQSSLGNLDSLPPELLQHIFAMLDFKTLSDLSLTCPHGATLVQSVPQYRDVIRHAPHAVIALARTELIRHFSADDVFATLLSADCVSCGLYGAFLFLPTCQRCCYDCLWRNPSLWVIPPSFAQECFGVSAAGIKTLPIMRSIPGEYHIRHTIKRKRPLKLVALSAAKKLALAEGRSEERLLASLNGRYREIAHRRYIIAARLIPPGRENLDDLPQNDLPTDRYCGMATVPFPYVVPGSHVEPGRWCLGCAALCRNWTPDKPVPALVAHLVARGCYAPVVVHDMQYVARSNSDFVKHIRDCPGAKEVFVKEILAQDNG